MKNKAYLYVIGRIGAYGYREQPTLIYAGNKKTALEKFYAQYALETQVKTEYNKIQVTNKFDDYNIVVAYSVAKDNQYYEVREYDIG